MEGGFDGEGGCGRKGGLEGGSHANRKNKTNTSDDARFLNPKVGIGLVVGGEEEEAC